MILLLSLTCLFTEKTLLVPLLYFFFCGRRQPAGVLLFVRVRRSVHPLPTVYFEGEGETVTMGRMSNYELL